MKKPQRDLICITVSQQEQVTGGLAIESLPQGDEPVEVPKDPIYISLEQGEGGGQFPDMLA